MADRSAATAVARPSGLTHRAVVLHLCLRLALGAVAAVGLGVLAGVAHPVDASTRGHAVISFPRHEARLGGRPLRATPRAASHRPPPRPSPVKGEVGTRPEPLHAGPARPLRAFDVEPGARRSEPGALGRGSTTRRAAGRLRRHPVRPRPSPRMGGASPARRPPRAPAGRSRPRAVQRSRSRGARGPSGERGRGRPTESRNAPKQRCAAGCARASGVRAPACRSGGRICVSGG